MTLFDDIANETVIRILINLHDIRNIFHCERVCHRFADIIQDDHFKACWLEAKFGARRALGSAILNTLNANLKTGYEKMLNDNVAMLLIFKGTDPHAIKDLPLVWAASRGYCTLFAHLLEAQAPHGEIVENVHQSYLDFPWAVSILNCYTTLYSMLAYPSEIIGLREASSPIKPLDLALHAACAAGMDHIVSQIINQQCIPININTSNCFALRVGIAGAHLKIIELLLARGAHLHHDTFTMCLDKYDDYIKKHNPARASIYRNIFASLFAAGGCPSQQQAIHLLERLYRDFDTTWADNMCLVSASNQCNQDDLAHLALKMLHDNNPGIALSVLSCIRVPSCLIHLIIDVSRNLIAHNLLSPNPDLLLVLAIQEHNLEFLHYLLLYDQHHAGLFAHPWCISLSSCTRPDLETIRILVRFDFNPLLTHSVVFRNTDSCAHHLENFLVRCPMASRQRSLDTALRQHIHCDDVKAIDMLTALGASAESDDVQHLLNDPAELQRLQPRTLAALVPKVERLRPRLIALLARLSGMKLRGIFETGEMDWKRWGNQMVDAMVKAENQGAIEVILSGSYAKLDMPEKE